MFFGTILAFAFWPMCGWLCYYRYMRKLDSHKAHAMAWGAYAAVGLTVHHLNSRDRGR